jgi:hypothetical protein
MQYLKQYGERLVALGYRIVPLPPGSKGPKRKGWPQFDPDAAQVRQWYMNGSANDGIGILARYTPAIDVDILDPQAAQEMSDLVDGIFPGQALMTRTGRAPKFLIPFRSDDPFKKLSSGVYTDGTNDHKVEILGDGQQWVAYHVHPETGLPYEWWDGLGDVGILGSAQSELPTLSRSDAQRVIDAFEVLAARMVDSGLWSRKSAPAERNAPASSGDDPFGGQPVGKSYREVEALLARLPNDDADYDSVWFPTLAAVHHELGAEGEDLARVWSAKAGKHTDERFDQTWNSLGRYEGPKRTLRSIMKQVAEKKLPPLERKSAGLVPAAQFASEQQVEWHIKHVIPKRGLIVVYGAPGSSKSFFVLDLVAHVARGLPWRGHKVRQANVAYVVAEGVAGFGNRLAAYAEGHDVPLTDVPLFIRGGSMLLADQVTDLCEQIEQAGNIGIVVIDTLAAVTPGANENTSEDMGKAIEYANYITEVTGASVILIHHANKQGEMRGWSGLLAAADNTIRVERNEDIRTAHIEKQKDGKDSGEYGYRLRVVDLGIDVDGDPITSCVVEECAETAPNTSGQRGKKERKARSGDFETSENYAKARDYLRIIREELGLTLDANIEESDVIAAIQKDPTANPLGEPDRPPRRYIIPTLRTLAEKGKIRKEGRWIRLCE